MKKACKRSQWKELLRRRCFNGSEPPATEGKTSMTRLGYGETLPGM